MIRQHLCQYTQLRHETDMFNQSVSVLFACSLCSPLPSSWAERGPPDLLWLPWVRGCGRRVCRQPVGVWCLPPCCPAPPGLPDHTSHCWITALSWGKTQPAEVHLASMSHYQLSQHEALLPEVFCLCKEDAELFHCWKKQCIYIFSLLKTGHLSSTKMPAYWVQLCLV